MTQIQFENITFDDQNTFGFTISRLTGWWDAAPIRVQVNDRPQADGAFGARRNYRGARTISVEGSWVGTSLVEAYNAMAFLTSMQPLGVPSVFRVVEPNGAKQSTVALANGPTLPGQLYQPFFTFSFDVVAYDPLKYGDAVTTTTGLAVSGGGLVFPLGSGVSFIDFGPDGSTGRALARNTGTASTYPTIEVTGGIQGGFVVTDVTTGQDVRFERDIPLGSTVVINQRTGRATIDGSGDVSGFITRRNFFAIPANDSHQIQFAALGATSGTPTLTVRTSAASW